MSSILNSEIVVNHMSNAAVLADKNRRIRYCNPRFRRLYGSPDDDAESFIGQDFYKAIRYPTFTDGCFAPLYDAPCQENPTRSTLSYTNDQRDRYYVAELAGRRFEMRVSYLELGSTVPRSDEPQFLIELDETTATKRVERQLSRLADAGKGLAYCTNEKLEESPSELRERFKQTIQDQMHDVLLYDVFEIRLLDKRTKELIPFSSLGVAPTASVRRLFAKSNDNGITGYVANSGESYICNDTKNDPLYIPGAIDALSSITVPLEFNGERIGVCNVESNRPNAFSQQDLAFLTLYAKSLALALYLLEFGQRKSFWDRESYNLILRNELDPAFYHVLDCVYETATVLQRGSNMPEFTEMTDRLFTRCYDLRERFEELTRPVFVGGQDVAASDAAQEVTLDSLNLDQEKLDALKSVLADKKALIVARDRQRYGCYGRWLEALGCRVEYIASSGRALFWLTYNRYDFVICERYPDGAYFGHVSRLEAHDDGNGVNVHHFNRYQIHAGDDYFVPAADNPADASERARIRREIYEEGKLDAFFLLKELYSHNLRLPFFLIYDNDEDYDPTHVRENVNNLRRSEGYRGRELTLLFDRQEVKNGCAQKIFYRTLLSVL